MHSLWLTWPTAQMTDLIQSQLILSDTTRKELHLNYAYNDVTITSVMVSLEGPKQ